MLAYFGSWSWCFLEFSLWLDHRQSCYVLTFCRIFAHCTYWDISKYPGDFLGTGASVATDWTIWVLRNSGTLGETKLHTHTQAFVVIVQGFFFKTSQCKQGIFMSLPLKTYWWYPSIPGPLGYINTHVKEDSTENWRWPFGKGIEDKP